METKTILIVDDEESILFVLRNSLLKFGHDYRILTALDGKSALKYFEKFQIDLVITDYRMNGMNGLELAETISNVQPGTRIIFITAFGNEDLEAKVNQLKVSAYLKKPLDLTTFRQAVKRALGDFSAAQPGMAVQASDLQLYLMQLIQQLQKEINANCVMIADIEEKSFITVGEIEYVRREQLTSFINTSLSIADKAGEFLDEENSQSLWLYRQGGRDALFAGRIDNQHLLIALINSQSQAINRGQVFGCLLAAGNAIRSGLADSMKAKRENLFGQGFNQAVQSELDKLFADDFANALSSSARPQAGSEEGQKTDSSFAMTYEEALSVGLILPTEDKNNPENH
jgi:CheY-like chemotaxis protein